MGLQGDHYGMALTVDDVDIENEAFFRYCAAQDFRLQRATDSGLLRYPPTTRCPFSGNPDYEWIPVGGSCAALVDDEDGLAIAGEIGIAGNAIVDQVARGPGLATVLALAGGE